MFLNARKGAHSVTHFTDLIQWTPFSNYYNHLADLLRVHNYVAFQWMIYCGWPRVHGLCQPVSLVVVCLQLLCVRFHSHARPVQSQTAVCLSGSRSFIHSLFHASTRAQCLQGPPTQSRRQVRLGLRSAWPHFHCLLVCLVCCRQRWSDCEDSSDSV